MKRASILFFLAVLIVGMSVLANDKPTAQFTFKDGETPYTVVFDASGSFDPDGTIVSYQWTFGDGFTGAGKNVTHTYPGAGSFDVTLVVFDDAHAAGMTTRTIVLTEAGTLSEVPKVQTASRASRANVPVGLDVGQAAPNFTLKDAAGKAVSLSDFLGKVVLLEFWRSTCPYCRDSMPHLQELLNKYKDEGLVVVLVALDRNIAAAQNYLYTKGYTGFINLWDDPSQGDHRVAYIYKVGSIPHALLIDRHGVIRYTGFPGHLLDSDIAPWIAQK